MQALPTVDHPFGDAFEIEFRIDEAAGRVTACRTAGLADFGFPELIIRPDEPFDAASPGCGCGALPVWPEPDEDDILAADDEPDRDEPNRDDEVLDAETFDAEVEASSFQVVRAAQMMALLALDVLTEDTLDVLPRTEELLDLPVRFWLGQPERIRFRAPNGSTFEEVAVPVHWVIE